MKFKLTPFSLRSLHLIHILSFLCHDVAANTEIINFSSSREPTANLPWDVVGNWSMLHPTDNERRWSLEPAVLHTPLHQVCEKSDVSVASYPPFSCPHELWLFLDLDDDKWVSFSTFTLRLSWPASAPADFSIALYSSQDVLARLSEREEQFASNSSSSSSTPERARSTRHAPTTRSRYARIRAVDAGVPTPGSRSHPLVRAPPLSPPRILAPHAGSDAPARAQLQSIAQERERERVPFVVILEPAYVGVLPATLLPTVGFLIPIVLAAAWFVRWVTAYFEPFVQQARVDLKVGMTRTNKER